MQVLVLGANLDAEGAELGGRTKARLDAAVAYLRHNRSAYIVSTTGFSTDYPAMIDPMGRMMVDYVQKTGGVCIGTKFLSGAKEFNTKGELDCFFLANPTITEMVVVSGRYHLLRVCFLIAQRKGWRFALYSTKYVPAPGDPSDWRSCTREVLAWFNIFTPPFLRPLIQDFVRKISKGALNR